MCVCVCVVLLVHVIKPIGTLSHSRVLCCSCYDFLCCTPSVVCDARPLPGLCCTLSLLVVSWRIMSWPRCLSAALGGVTHTHTHMTSLPVIRSCPALLFLSLVWLNESLLLAFQSEESSLDELAIQCNVNTAVDEIISARYEKREIILRQFYLFII